MKYSRLFLIVTIICAFIASLFHYSALVEEEQKDLQNFNHLYAERIVNALDEGVQRTLMLEKVVHRVNGKIPASYLELLGELFYDTMKYTFIVYSPNGIVEYIYPTHDPENLLGTNIFETARSRIDANLSRQEGTISFSGPYLLSSGEANLTIRNPIYLNRDGEKMFWGFVSVGLKPFEAILEEIGIVELEQFGIEYYIQSNYNGEKVELAKSTGFDIEAAPPEHIFNVGSSEWTITVYDSQAQNTAMLYFLLTILAYIFIIIAIYFVLKHLERKNEIVFLQSITDSLTRLKNKKALDLLIKDTAQWQENGFSCFYIDLNKFKPVNDTYGHDVGDKLLYTFAQRLVNNFAKDTFIARVGGDEFVLIILKSLDEENCKQIQTRIISLAEVSFYLDDISVEISASIGFAVHSKDSDEAFEDVLARADNNMFSYKETHGKGR